MNNLRRVEMLGENKYSGSAFAAPNINARIQALRGLRVAAFLRSGALPNPRRPSKRICLA